MADNSDAYNDTVKLANVGLENLKKLALKLHAAMSRL